MAEALNSLSPYFQHPPTTFLIGQGVGFIAGLLCLQSGVAGVFFGMVFMATAQLIEYFAFGYFSSKFKDKFNALIVAMGVDVLGRGLAAWTFTCICIGWVSILPAVFFTVTLYAVDLAVRMQFAGSKSTFCSHKKV